MAKDYKTVFSVVPDRCLLLYILIKSFKIKDLFICLFVYLFFIT